MKYSWILLLLLLGCQQTQPNTASSPATSPEPVASTSPAGAVSPSASPGLVGAPAPAVTGVDQDGNSVDFDALYKQGPVLVFFYPKAGTAGCTAQACSLRDAYEVLQEKGLTVVGVSRDTQQEQQAFKSAQQLPYTLVADPDGKVLEAFQVPSTGGFANREAFLIKDGQVVWHDGSASTATQAQDVLQVMSEWK